MENHQIIQKKKEKEIMKKPENRQNGFSKSSYINTHPKCKWNELMYQKAENQWDGFKNKT